VPWFYLRSTLECKETASHQRRANHRHRQAAANLVYLRRDGDPEIAITAVEHAPHDVCFSNRPFRVKHFQAIHQCGVDVARGLVLLSGIGTWALPSWDSRTGRNNLLGGLTVN
jgi:hypothetical protein